MVGENFTPRHPDKKVISIFTQGSANPEMGAEKIKVINNMLAAYGWELTDCKVALFK
ncbi:hypothetical protein [Clostridium chromiireducens]|uniref:hypothetical protein n=1 Tax=Clostridium chromiireducens TaxID=225345 RepID=UPI0019207134|nr:hypothetical protein [Clostridium chromiireducens]